MLSKANFFEKFSTVPPGLGSQPNGIYFSSVSMKGLEEMHKYSTNEKLYEFFEYGAFKHQSETAKYIEKLLRPDVELGWRSIGIILVCSPNE